MKKGDSACKEGGEYSSNHDRNSALANMTATEKGQAAGKAEHGNGEQIQLKEMGQMGHWMIWRIQELVMGLRYPFVAVDGGRCARATYASAQDGPTEVEAVVGRRRKGRPGTGC